MRHVARVRRGWGSARYGKSPLEERQISSRVAASQNAGDAFAGALASSDDFASLPVTCAQDH